MSAEQSGSESVISAYVDVSLPDSSTEIYFTKPS